MITREFRSFSRRYKPDQAIAFAGDAADCLLRLEGGLVRVSRLSVSGEISTLRLIRPGDYFAEEALTDGRHRNDVIALSEVTVCSVNPDTLDATEQRIVLASLARQLRRSTEHGFFIQNCDLRERIIWYLLELFHSALGGIDGRGQCFIRSSHRLIGEGIGAKRESVSKVLTALRDEGILTTGYRQLLGLDLPALMQIIAETTNLEDMAAFPNGDANTHTPTAAMHPIESPVTTRFPVFVQ
jgi:CRP/FNR family transcriptional regulator, LitR-dependent transcriptional activator